MAAELGGGGSMKNMATGAPPPGFAAFMKKKAEAAKENKDKLEAERKATYMAMRLQQMHA